MNQTTRTLILAAAVTAIAAPVFADTICTVNALELRLRKTPSMKARVVAVLKKDQQVTTAGDCAGGWVKVSSTDGSLTGYVGGWALTSNAPKASAEATPAPSAQPEAAKPEAVIPVTAPPKEVPSNEKLAMQITELRLNVLGIERDMDKMNQEIQKIKTSIGKKKGHKKQAKK
ncbi:hypothetical protein GMLC_35310 [Geomonas limicola]|uniref:SH3b domain-containing protein n=1 Tax=Geomonas limicola TaxID=2740186 RepID=A0A6V8NBE7_9BACT|nr:SH3 domain-containing protein [Geomonas limicola]GFO69952.1 hypothetical protein GMLC_35310 [Geomonas limicola]